MNKKLLYLIGIVLFFGILWLSPVPEGLTKEGYYSILIMMATVVIWVTEVLPIAFAGVFFTVLPAVLHITPLPKMMANFATPVIFFVFSMFIMSVAFNNSGFSRRIVLLASLKSKGNPSKLLLYLMLASGFLSCIFADIPVMAVMVPIAAMMIGLAFACLIG